jgi:LysR family transcriptional regulator, hca operon transcriptional activator
VLSAVTEDYLRRSGLDIKLDHGVDNMAMAMSLVASTRGLALMPAYAKNLLPSSVVSRPLEGEAPTIDVAVGYSKSNTSPILKLFLSRLDELGGPTHRNSFQRRERPVRMHSRVAPKAPKERMSALGRKRT